MTRSIRQNETVKGALRVMFVGCSELSLDEAVKERKCQKPAVVLMHHVVD